MKKISKILVLALLCCNASTVAAETLSPECTRLLELHSYYIEGDLVEGHLTFQQYKEGCPQFRKACIEYLTDRIKEEVEANDFQAQAQHENIRNDVLAIECPR